MPPILTLLYPPIPIQDAIVRQENTSSIRYKYGFISATHRTQYSTTHEINLRVLKANLRPNLRGDESFLTTT
jgi:hypothetical protein